MWYSVVDGNTPKNLHLLESLLSLQSIYLRNCLIPTKKWRIWNDAASNRGGPPDWLVGWAFFLLLFQVSCIFYICFLYWISLDRIPWSYSKYGILFGLTGGALIGGLQEAYGMYNGYSIKDENSKRELWNQKPLSCN